MKMILTAMFTIVVLVFVAAEASGDTHVVDDTTGGWQDHDSIQDAVNASSDGDTILVFAGYYTENVTVRKDVTITGNGSGNTTLYGAGTGDAIYIRANGTSVSGLKVVNSVWGTAGIHLDHAWHIQVDDINLTSVHRGVEIDYGGNITLTDVWINRSASYGMDVYYADGLTIEGLAMWWTSHYGFYCSYTDHLDIIDPFLRLSAAYGFYLLGCDWVNITSPYIQNTGVHARGVNDMTLTDATFELTDSYFPNAIDVGGNRIDIDNVVITDYYNAINIVSTDNITVRNSVISGTSSNSFDVYGGTGYVAENVTIDGGFTGIEFDHSDYPRIIDCTITNSTHGLRIASCYRARIWNNTIRDCEYNFGFDGIYDDHFRPYLPANNTVQGRTIRYYYGIDNMTYDGKDDDIGYLIVAFCDNLTFQHLDLNNNQDGIWIYKSKNVYFEDYDIVHVFYQAVRSFYSDHLYFDDGYISESEDQAFDFANSNDIEIRSVTVNGTYEVIMTSAVDRLDVNWMNITNSTQMHWYVDDGRLENLTWYNKSIMFILYSSVCLFQDIDIKEGMIRVSQSWNNTFREIQVRKIPSLYTGFWLETQSICNLIENFTVGNGDYYGFRFNGQCNWNILRNGTIHDVKYALELDNSGKNTFENVNMTGDYAICMNPNPYGTLDLPWIQTFTNSTANGKPVLFLVDEQNTEYNGDYGFIGVARCDNVKVTGSILTSNRYGFMMWKGVNSTFEDINATDQETAGFYMMYSSNCTLGPLKSYPGRTQDRGLFARYCDNTTFVDMEVMWFDQVAVLLESCDNCTILNSTFQDNYAGHSAASVAIKIDRGNWNTVENCNISHWDIGVHLFGAYSWEDPSYRNRVSNSTFYDIMSTNDATAIYAERGTNYELHGNDINISCVGIYLYQTGDINVSGNWVRGVKSWTTITYDYGLRVSSSSTGTVYDNAFQNKKNVLDDSGLRWNVSKVELGWPNTTNVIGGPSLGGNFYSDYEGIDEDSDGIGEWVYNVTGTAGSVDHLPLTNAVWGSVASCYPNGTSRNVIVLNNWAEHITHSDDHWWYAKGNASVNGSWLYRLPHFTSMPLGYDFWNDGDHWSISSAEVYGSNFLNESPGHSLWGGNYDMILDIDKDGVFDYFDAIDNGSTTGMDYGCLVKLRINTTTGSGTVIAHPTVGLIRTNWTWTNVSDLPDVPDGEFRHGVFDFVIRNLDNGSSTKAVFKLPDDNITQYSHWWMYGPTPSNSSYHWYTYPFEHDIGTATITINLTDGSKGDSDLSDDGSIFFIGGPVVADGLEINYSTTFDPGTYYLNDTGGSGAIRVTGSDFVIDCTNTTFIGNGTGTCFYFDNCTNVTLIGAWIEDYDIGLEVINSVITCPDLTVYPVSWGAVFDPSEAVFINCTFDEGFDVDSGSKVTVMNYLHILVRDAGGDPVEGADVKVTDNNVSIYATEYYGGRDGNALTTGDNDNQTGADGYVWSIPVTYCVYNGSNTPTYNDTHVYVRWRLWTDDADVNMSTSHTETFQADVFIPEFPLVGTMLMLAVVVAVPMGMRRRRRST